MTQPAISMTQAKLPSGWLGVQLQRLERLIGLQDAHAAHLNASGQRLLHRAIFATYVEVRDLGGAQLAAEMLARGDAASKPEAPVSVEDAAGPSEDRPAG